MNDDPTHHEEEARFAQPTAAAPVAYGRLVSDISGLLEQARREAARSVNAILTATYWEIGRRIVEHEQGGKARAEYGESLLTLLAKDLTNAHGRGFSKSNLFLMRAFFLRWEIFQTPSGIFEAKAKFPTEAGESEAAGIRMTVSSESANAIFQTPSAKFGTQAICPVSPNADTDEKSQTPSDKSEILQTVSARLSPAALPGVFPLSWSHYVLLMAVDTFCSGSRYTMDR